MRISCDVDVANRLLPSFNLSSKGKQCRTQLSVGKKPGDKDDEVYLMLCTKQDRNGAKYKLKGNIVQFFTKFISDGKATVRFKDPPHDLCLSKADPIQLKGLLTVLRMGCQGQGLEKVTLSNLAPASTKQVEKLKTRLTITTRKDYPITTNFPSGLEVLSVLQCNLKRVDSRMLKLKNLTKLNLSQNHIRELPDDFEAVPKLAELILSDNQLDSISQSFCSGSLSNSLTHLDLCKNKLKMLRPFFCKLRNLVTLKLDSNELVILPGGIGKLTQLRYLTAANNQLRTLPAGFTGLQLDHLDVNTNMFLQDGPSTPINRLSMPTLVELCARTIAKKRVAYTVEEVGPLYDYLSTNRRCMCGQYCFQSHVHYLARVNLGRVAASVTAIDSNGRTHAPCEAFLCSQVCLERYQKNPYATMWK